MVYILNKFEKDYELIDVCKWNNLLEKMEDNKIVIFGAGNNGQVLLELLPYKVDYFIDNDENKVGKFIENILVRNPDYLKEETDNVCVLITGFLYADMLKQLKNLKLKGNIKIYNVYTLLKRIFDKRSFFYRGEALINFIESIPKDIIIDKKSKESKETISVVVTNFSFSSSTFYSIVLAVMLNIRGNNVEIIWDDLEGVDELYYDCDNITNVQNHIIEKVLNYTISKFDIRVIRVSQVLTESIDDEDIIEIKKLAKINTISKFRKIFFTEEEYDYEQKCFKVLEKNIKKVNGLFINRNIKKIVTFTGIHRKLGLYNWLAKRYGIQSISYDGANSSLLITTDGICTHYDHVKKMLEDNKISNDLSKRIIDFADKNFNDRLSSIDDIKSYVYQTVKYDESNIDYEYDVVIPLNIGWDAAALGYDSIFDSMGDWLIETIQYILINTDAKIVVRQHPAERFFDSGKDIESKLRTVFPNNDRLIYISSDDEVNTYSLIKKSKLVLPHTSTVGIEATLLNRPVIMATNVYYSDMNFVKKADSKYEYFAKIKNTIYGDSKFDNKFINEAKLLYGLIMITAINTKFTDVNFNNWINDEFNDLYNEYTVKSILKIIETGDAIDIYSTENRFNVNIFS